MRTHRRLGQTVLATTALAMAAFLAACAPPGTGGGSTTSTTTTTVQPPLLRTGCYQTADPRNADIFYNGALGFPNNSTIHNTVDGSCGSAPSGSATVSYKAKGLPECTSPGPGWLAVLDSLVGEPGYYVCFLVMPTP